MTPTRFHLAFPVHDLSLAKSFYKDILECEVGRESNNWIDFNLFGHQIVAHLSPGDCNLPMTKYVDGDNVPSRHFGLILHWAEWEKLYKNLQRNNIIFYIKPKIRFKDQNGEQGTFFLKDPSGNALEFKSSKDFKYIFKK